MVYGNKPITAAKLLVVVGPTASGKSELAMKVAEKFNGEIICADSRTVYKGLDIGTAKPTKEDRARVPHHLLDIVEADHNFTVADFKHLAEQAIAEIRTRNRLPIMVGGSGLYIDAVLFNYEFSGDGARRDETNPRHLHKDASSQRKPMRSDALVVGLNVPKDVLKQRIANRINIMIKDGFIDEVIDIQARYPDSKALLAPGYKAFAEHLAGRLSKDEAINLFIRNDVLLAKKQMTWFKRNKKIHWLTNPYTYVEQTMMLLN